MPVGMKEWLYRLLTADFGRQTNNAFNGSNGLNGLFSVWKRGLYWLWTTDRGLRTEQGSSPSLPQHPKQAVDGGRCAGQLFASDRGLRTNNAVNG